MRQGNVLVKLPEGGRQLGAKEELPVKFYDFDWSGLVDQTQLPPFARQRLSGYGAGQEMTQGYDVDLWEHELLHGDT